MDWVSTAKLSALHPDPFNAVYCITNPQLSVRVFIGQLLALAGRAVRCGRASAGATPRCENADGGHLAFFGSCQPWFFVRVRVRDLLRATEP
jgi:hypothetical protein